MRSFAKRIFFASVALLLLCGMALGIWLWSLNTWLENQLESKKFFAPTEYWGGLWRIEQNETFDFARFIKILNDRQYQEKPWGEPLGPGEFWRGNSDQCAQIQGEICVIFRIFDTEDPELKNSERMEAQALSWSESSNRVQTWSGQNLRQVPFVVLESQLLLRLVSDRPIRQEWTSLGSIPPACLQSVLAIEDHNFLEHRGVSFIGIMRALFTNLVQQKKAQGGSTITQQTVKNSFLTNEKTLSRKWKEFWIALLLEFHQDKDSILETYLNIIYMGQSGPFEIRGFPAASLHYFNKPIADLDWPECTLLAGLLNSPGLFDPFRNPDRAKQRQVKVITKLLENKMITTAQASSLEKTPLKVIKSQTPHATLPYYIDKVRREFPIESESPGHKFFLSTQSIWQESAEKAIQTNLSLLRQEEKALQAMALGLSLQTGQVTFAIGGGSFKESQFNRALDGKRQIGSLIKPLLLSFYFQHVPNTRGWDLVEDSEVVIRKNKQPAWRPQNYDRKFRGPVPLFEALAFSYNLPFVNLYLGMEKIIPEFPAFLELGGLKNSKFPVVPAVALGAIEMSPLELLTLYSTLAREGNFIEPLWVRGVFDNNSKEWTYIAEPEVIESVWDRNATLKVLNLMEQTVKIGTGKSLLIDFPAGVAAKTGTTSDSRDAWFVGIAQNQIVLVWVGVDSGLTDKTKKMKLSGARAALPIWRDLMLRVYPSKVFTDFSWKADSSFQSIDWQNEQLQLIDN